MCPVSRRGVWFGYLFIWCQRPAGRRHGYVGHDWYYSRWPSWKEGRTPAGRRAWFRARRLEERGTDGRSDQDPPPASQPSAVGSARALDFARPSVGRASPPSPSLPIPSGGHGVAEAAYSAAAVAVYSWRTEIIMCIVQDGTKRVISTIGGRRGPDGVIIYG